MRTPLLSSTALAIICLACVATANGAALAEQDDAAAIRQAASRYFAAYNESLYYAAALFIGRSARTKCRGIDGVAAALQRNARAERIRYSLVRLRITARKRAGRPVEADVYVRERDARTGAVPNTNGLGLRFVREGGWTFAELFPVGASSFCR